MIPPVGLFAANGMMEDMTEAKLQTKFTKWLKTDWKMGAAAFELKVSRGDRLAYSAIPDHQMVALRDSGGAKGMVHKISDSAIGYKPFDCFILQDVMTFYVIGFNGGADVYMVEASDVWDLIVDKKTGDRRRGSMPEFWAAVNGVRIEV